MSSAPTRRNLIIVRAGDSSLHPRWLKGESDRTWDLVVSYFGKSPDIYRQSDVTRIDSIGPKWPPLQQLLHDHPEYIDNYDFIWLPDDDLEMKKPDINLFFTVCAERGLELAQPSLSADSPMTHPLLINNAASRIRYTNFVEVMAPCFSSSCLRRVLPTFSETQSGWGIDWLWPRFVQNRETGIAIVDDVVIRHTRPLGGPNYDAMRAAGKSPKDELLRFEERQKVEQTRVYFHKVIWRNESSSSNTAGTRALQVQLMFGFLKALIVSPHRWTLLKQLIRRIVSPPSSVLVK